MHPSLILSLLLAVEPPRSLSPAAAEHNTRAMQHYDAGRFGPAVDEFYAAYQTMPDVRRDREGRELLLSSMRATLLELYRETRGPAPLCRLQKILKEHLDAHTATYPAGPESQEARSVRARYDEVTRQLASFRPTACDPPPPPVVAAPPVAPATAKPTASPPPPAPDVIPPRHLVIAGGVTLGLGGVLLGVMTYGLLADARARRGFRDIRDDTACSIASEDLGRLQALRSDALTARSIAIGTGIAAGLTAAIGGTLLALAHRSTRAKRWSAAPWWTPAGAGLTFRMRLGAAR